MQSISIMTYLFQLILLHIPCIWAAANIGSFVHSSSRCSLVVNPLAFQIQYTRYGRSNRHLHRSHGFRYTNHPRSYIGRSLHSNLDDSHNEESNIPMQSTQMLPATTQSNELSRRAILLNLLTLSALTSIPSQASSSQIDATGNLYSPKAEMLSRGGSAAARGIKLPRKERSGSKTDLLQTRGLIQDVYETRFVAYLTRFLLVFDSAAGAWWKKNTASQQASTDELTAAPNSDGLTLQQERFAEFAESVEVGLADYFLGPYGSYASVAAAKAGISAAEPAKSTRRNDTPSFWDVFYKDRRRSTRSSATKSKNKKNNPQLEKNKLARQGVLNLFSLLKARYTTIEQKQQLALLFSLISDPQLQPVSEIRSLLGELDNGTIAAIELLDISDDDDDTTTAKDYFRLSSRQGGGFAKDDARIVNVEAPAPLGDDYKPAKIRAVLKPTSRILRIEVVDGGEGYTVAPEVIVRQKGVARQCEAYAVINQLGKVTEIIVVNPGFGYGGQTRNGINPIVPTVEIRRNRKGKSNEKVLKSAKAVAELEYKVSGVEILDGGSGYIFDEPPEVSLSLPEEDPDWFVAPVINGRNTDGDEAQMIAARVSLMRGGLSNITIDPLVYREQKLIGESILTPLRDDPIALLPSYLRPRFSMFASRESFDALENGCYYIPTLPRSQSVENLPSSSKYRSIDPLFGGIGKAPVIKNAVTLSADQYSRLALAGAICTVLVRTALNPLELVKTKIQLKNDDEIIQLATEKASVDTKDGKEETASKPAVGTAQVIQSLIEVRGPFSLFQSADITFLTSVVFGIFGFGATELFRRSFSAIFFDEDAGGSELVLLAAAGFATLLTCAAGAPFEILRVRSMSIVEAKGVKDVFFDLVEQNRQRKNPTKLNPKASPSTGATLNVEDIKPLWLSFNPIVSRELPFAVTKFLVFDLTAGTISDFINGSNLLGDNNKIQVGVGTLGLLLSAFSGALAGIAGAFVSHPADLILTLTSASSREEGPNKDWKAIIQELLKQEGGVLNLYAGFPARAVFFFLVIGLQFFLYDFFKTLLDVGTDDLTLVLDVFYAIRSGLQ